MRIKLKRVISIIMSFVVVMSVYTVIHNPIYVNADGAMTGTSWGSGSSGNIILTKQTALRLGFDKRAYGSYKNYGYLGSYPSIYKGYSIILGTCGNLYNGSSYTNNVVLAPTNDGTGKIDYVKSENMFLSRPSEASLYQAIWDMTMGGTFDYSGDGVTSLKNGKSINLDAVLGKGVADEIRRLSGSDWNTAKFHEDISWITPLNQNSDMKDNAMAMVLIATYLNWRGADYDLKQIYNYYTRQSSDCDYILVLENFHGAMKSDDKQPFFTHQNYIFDAVTGYHVHNSMRKGTVADWYNTIKNSQTKTITPTYISGNLTELYATGNSNNPTRQLFCHFFASRNGKLVGNRMALSAYFFRNELLNYDLSQEVIKSLVSSDPLKYWYTKQYNPHSELGDSWASDFTRYKTGFAVFKSVPPISPVSEPPTETTPKGGHTLSVTPVSQEVKRFEKLSKSGTIIKTDIKLTPDDNELTSLSNTVYSLLYNWTSVADGKLNVQSDTYNASYLNDRRLIFSSADWTINFKGDEITESKSNIKNSSGNDSIGSSSISGTSKLGKGNTNDLIICRSEITGSSKEEKVASIKSILAEKLTNYSLSKYITNKYITSHDGKFDSLGTFTWNFDSLATVNISVEDRFGFGCEGGELSDYSEMKEVIYRFNDKDNNIVEITESVERTSLVNNVLYSDWVTGKGIYYSSNVNQPVSIINQYNIPVDFGKSEALASFNVTENKTVTYRWKNNPKAFAEIKQGSFSDNRSTEAWDVMQGIPTTEELYVSIGGTPYYIDIIADYNTVSFAKDFEMPYTTTSHSKGENGGIIHKTSNVSYHKTTKSFTAGYFVINNITLRPCDKAVITPNKTLFADGREIEIDFMDNITAKAVIESNSSNYYEDNYGDNENIYSYGITDVSESTLVKKFGRFSQSCTTCDRDTERHADHFNSELRNHRVFVNSPGVKLEIYNDNELINTLDILRPYNYSANIVDAESINLRSDSGLWLPDSWANEYEVIKSEGYTGQPDLPTGRNKDNKFYGKMNIKMNNSAQNGRYDFPETMVNDKYTEEIEQGLESLAEKYVTYMNLGEAQEYGPGICINNISLPTQYPIPLNYTDKANYPSERDGLNPIIIHNPISIQDVSIGTSLLTEQRIGFDNPLGKQGATTRIDINDYFTLYTPTDGAFVRSYDQAYTNVGSTNSNYSDSLRRGLLISEMYKVKQLGQNGFINASIGALGRGYNGTTSDVTNIIPSVGGIRQSGESYMDTARWTAYKFVKFPFAVLFSQGIEAAYVSPNTWISIPIKNTETRFIVSGNQKDISNTEVKFTAISYNAANIGIYDANINKGDVQPINDRSISALIDSAYNTAEASVNYSRSGNNTANHYVKNSFNVDVVGRIGNLTIDYCDDPSISQNFETKYMRTKYNMYDAENGVLNLSGTLNSHLSANSLGTLPLVRLTSNKGINATPKLGYGINYSLQTIGDYGDESSGKKLTIIPSYKIDGKAVTDIRYLKDSMTLERIYNVAENDVSYKINNSLNSNKAKVNKVADGVYSLGDVVSWDNLNPKGIVKNDDGGIIINSNINQVMLGSPSNLIIPVNLRTFIGYKARSKTNSEALEFKLSGLGDNASIKSFNTNHQRWFGQFSLPSSSKFYIESDSPVDTFDKSVLVSFEITTDISNAGWALHATDSIIQTGKPKTVIPIIEFNISETSADDMTNVGTH